MGYIRNNAVFVSSPRFTAFGVDGTIFVATRVNIWAWSSGTWGILAGPPVLGVSSQRVDGGRGTNAFFSSFTGLAATASTLFVADGHSIRAVTLSDQTVQLYAGQVNQAGYQDGVGTSARFALDHGTTARFSSPSSCLAADLAGNVYVADKSNYCIRKITPARAVSTIAGECETPGMRDTGAFDYMTYTTFTVARFYSLGGLVVGGSDLYVADTNRIRKIRLDASFSVSSLTGEWTDDITPGYSDGYNYGESSQYRRYNLHSALFSSPAGVAWFDIHGRGVLAVADVGNNQLRLIDTTQFTITTIAGRGAASKSLAGPAFPTSPDPNDLPPAAAAVYQPLAVGFSPDGANIYALDVNGLLLNVSLYAPCPAGAFCSGLTENSFGTYAECQPGFACPAGSSSQRPCSAGSFASFARSSNCSNCPAGTWTDAVQQSSCTH